jgi:hypothetical protein
VAGKNHTAPSNTLLESFGVGGTYSVSPALPSGLSLNTSTGAITGKPVTQTASAQYVISRNFTGATAHDTLTVTVNGFTYGTASANYPQNAAITANTVGSVIGAGGTYSITPSLPGGLSLNTSTGAISGTPTIPSSATKYAVTRTFTGADASDTVTIGVTLVAPTTLAYAAETSTYGKNASISANTATVGGTTTGLTFALQGGTLPTGLSLNTSTGAITGKPTVAGSFEPIIRVSNDSGSVDDTLTITVNGFSYASATSTYGKGHTITSNTVSGVTGVGGSYSVIPALPSGLSLNTSTGAITGTPTAQTAVAQYAISRTFTGATAHDTITMTVNGFSYTTASPGYAQNEAITPNTVTSVIGAGGTYSVSPSLPDGLSLNTSTGAISGTPTLPSSATKFAVTRTFTGADATDTVTISVGLGSPTSLNYTLETARTLQLVQTLRLWAVPPPAFALPSNRVHFPAAWHWIQQQVRSRASRCRSVFSRRPSASATILGLRIDR